MPATKFKMPDTIAKPSTPEGKKVYEFMEGLANEIYPQQAEVTATNGFSTFEKSLRSNF